MPRHVLSLDFCSEEVDRDVKNLVPHHSLYNYGRMQEVCVDR